MDEKYPSRQNNEILINRLMTKWIYGTILFELFYWWVGESGDNFFDETYAQGQDIKFN